MQRALQEHLETYRLSPGNPTTLIILAFLHLQFGRDADALEWGMRQITVGRCFERIGDNAVDIGEQTAFLVTGEFREFTDASH